jgi:hypothetical protein
VPNTWQTIGLSAGSAPATGPAVTTQDLQASGTTASVQFGSFGTAAWSAGDWGTPTQTTVSGPQMSSWTYRKPIGGDAHLVAWLEVRAYRGGRVEVLPWIENGFLKVAGPTSKSATATFTLGGTQRFSQALTLLNHQRAVLASGSTLTHWVGGDPQVTPRHDAAYLMATKLVPNYRANSSANSPLFGRLATSYTPLDLANFPDAMGTAGYHPSIGLLPEWDVAYLSSAGDPRAYRAVVINADALFQPPQSGDRSERAHRRARQRQLQHQQLHAQRQRQRAANVQHLAPSIHGLHGLHGDGVELLR